MAGTSKTTAAQDKGDSTKTKAAETPTGTGSQNEPQNGPATVTGPGTGTPSAPESSYRPPAGLANEENPLDPPADSGGQTEPEQGYNPSSTDHVAAEAGRRTIAGEDHKGLVDENGKALKSGSLFDDSDASKTFVVTKTRIYEEFYYPGTTEVAKRLMFAEGRRVPRAQAERIKAALDSAPTPAAEE